METEHHQSLHQIARKALQSGAYVQAYDAYERYLEQNPGDEQALMGAAEVCRFMNKLTRVVELYERGWRAAPDNVEIRAGYIEAVLADARADEALDLALSALKDNPDTERFKLQLAQIHIILGNADAARLLFEECLDKNPDCIDAGFYLSQLIPIGDLDALKEALDALWKRRDTFDAWQQTTLASGRARIAERQKRYDDAWDAFSASAKLRRGIIRFDEAQITRTHDAHARQFKNIPATTAADRTAGAAHIFIVSLPRSGSTLVEQILDCHPKAEAIGERSIVFDAVNYWFNKYGPNPTALFRHEALRGARQFYIDGARKLAVSGDTVIVDKSITNYIFLGFLRTIMPGARFVHVVRDPLDTAVSCFTTSFYGGNEWTYDLAEIGRAIRRYQKLTSQWLKAWPDDIHTVRYEDLVTDPESSAKEILKFCNLDWDPACLRFHESKRHVLTASVLQVRKPIYQSAKGRAAPYGAHLGALKAALGKACDPDWHRRH